ncbi:hypothetical protein ZYGR_0AD06760 [Zygosaccharomyces rouxii]|uniref:Zn(2)-C6 fungal-type domain-containing protein n=1 Tax=Zygosaccharomyces rouxii TaxID=4956 RepID=A0A1Q3A799_ZYGRO|nr:hypothetical protein ZYGR_0AD06760 [Zygosaccharomyces rouxii]
MAINSIKGRTFTGCWACRLKKRRCDERRPQCTLCAKHNDSCCYDVKLVWLDENLHKVVRGKYKTRAQLLGDRYHRRMSKEDLKSLVRGGISPVSEIDEIEASRSSSISSNSSGSSSSSSCGGYSNSGSHNSGDNKNDGGSFTVSVRRLKIYNNAVASVYGRIGNRNYNQRHVNQVLDRMLNHLEAAGPRREAKEGPFTFFGASLNSKKDIHLPSPLEPLPLSPTTKTSEYVSHWIDQELTALLWLQQQDPVLSNYQFRQWYLEHIRQTVSIEFCQSIQESFTPSFLKTYFPQWFPIALTILIASQGYTMELESELEAWVLEQKTLQMFMLPAVSMAAFRSQSYPILCHCNNLLSGCSQWPEAQLLELYVTSKLVDQWEDKIMQQLCGCQDASQSCSQLKFWQAQLEKFRSVPI